jgi:hypothetical protein
MGIKLGLANYGKDMGYRVLKRMFGLRTEEKTEGWVK